MATYDDWVHDPNTDYRHLHQKVYYIENTLKTFQSEVQKKMNMMEQVLALKNEQLTLQKQLLDRESTLYDTIVSQWNIMVDQIPVGGVPGPFPSATPDFNNSNQNSCSSRSLGKHMSTSSISDAERKRLIAKRRRINDVAVDADLESSYDNETPHDTFNKDPLVNDAPGLNSDGDTTTDDQDVTGDVDYEEAEKKIFAHDFIPQDETPPEGNNDPLWDHFLQSENGTILMCKHCHEKGFQKIYKLTPTTGKTVARNHLRVKHKIHIERPPAEAEGDPNLLTKDPAPEKVPGCRRKTTFLRHKNYLYQLSTKRNSATYWRCREYDTCNGKIIRRDGIIRESTEHACLTTATDCDAYELREKLKDLAEDHPLLSPNDIIASAKEGYSDEVLQLLPNDDSLRRTILRIRKALLTSAPT